MRKNKNVGMTLQEFSNKADYEGGLLEAVFGYGLGPEDVADSKLKKLLTELIKVKPIIEEIENMLPEPGDEE